MDAAVDQPDHIARTRSLPDAVILACAEILACVVGYSVCEGEERRRNQVVELYACGVARHNHLSERVDDALNDDVAHGDKTLLEYARYCDDGDIAEHFPRENFWLGIRFDFFQLQEYEDYGQYATYALAKEGCPSNARHTHFERHDEPNIHADVGK